MKLTQEESDRAVGMSRKFATKVLNYEGKQLYDGQKISRDDLEALFFDDIKSLISKTKGVSNTPT